MFYVCLGTGSFYHSLRDIHGIGKDTVFRSIHKVLDLLFDLREEYIHWPENPIKLSQEFYEVARMPSVCGCVDGSHIPIIPPHNDEASYVNRHHQHSINALAVCGPDLKVYYVFSRAPGRWHDSHVNLDTFNEFFVNYKLVWLFG